MQGILQWHAHVSAKKSGRETEFLSKRTVRRPELLDLIARLQERVLRKAAQMLCEDHQKSISGNADASLR